MTNSFTTHSTLRPAVAGWLSVFAPMEGSLRIAVVLNKHNRQLPQGCFPDA